MIRGRSRRSRGRADRRMRARSGPAEDGDPDGFYQAALDSQKTLVELAKASQDLGLKVCGIRDIGS